MFKCKCKFECVCVCVSICYAARIIVIVKVCVCFVGFEVLKATLRVYRACVSREWYVCAREVYLASETRFVCFN